MLTIHALSPAGAIFGSTTDDHLGRVFGPVMTNTLEASVFAMWLAQHGIDPETDLTDRGLSYRLTLFREEVAEHPAVQPGRIVCDRCDGCGWYEGGKSVQTQCEVCGGSGVVARVLEETGAT